MLSPSSPATSSHGAAIEADGRWLERAAALARRGWGQVHPNPMVGCVLVRPGRSEGGEGEGEGEEAEVLGEGWHRAWGGPHAEVEALAAARQAGHDPRGATAYVSLEPCNHQGKTPPCSVALQAAGVARVVYGAADPGARSGGGGAALAREGVEVRGPLFDRARAHRENPAFFHAFGSASWRPWVVLKLAVSADGHIAARPGERTAISGPEASARVQWLRAGVEAIMVGGRTALVDDPLLTVRGAVTPRVPPRRILLDAGSQVGPEARVFREGAGEVIHLVGEGRAPGGAPGGTPGDAPGGTPAGDPGLEGRAPGSRSARTHPIPPVHREVLPLLPPAHHGDLPRFELAHVLRRLRELEITALLCEGGGELASALLAADLVDRLVLVSSPRALGAEGVPAFPGQRVHPTGHEAPWASGEGWKVAEEPVTLGGDRWQSWDRERS
jgi:diaminohydroxyphosphoribosylaminopyrimidine deaminase/5-amino-6-(5-phosphoribosylamino)uracil reductase